MEVDIYKMLYKIKNTNINLRILGDIFVRNNKNKGKLIINNKKKKIIDLININFIKTNEFKIKLLLCKHINNKSYFFKDCASLLKLSLSNMKKNLENDLRGNILKFDIEEEKDESFLDLYPEEQKNSTFYENIENYPFDNISEISKTKRRKKSSIYNKTIRYDLDLDLNLFYVYSNFREMFFNCSSLNSLSDIFQFNNNIIDISCMFYNCLSLTAIPNISEWNIEKVTDLGSLFYNCASLESLPYISKWNTKNVEI